MAEFNLKYHVQNLLKNNVESTHLLPRKTTTFKTGYKIPDNVVVQTNLRGHFYEVKIFKVATASVRTDIRITDEADILKTIPFTDTRAPCTYTTAGSPLPGGYPAAGSPTSMTTASILGAKDSLIPDYINRLLLEHYKKMIDTPF